MNTKTLTGFFVVGLLAFAVSVAFGAPIYFAGTDHFYEVVDESGLDWDAADTAAQAKSHLGTNGYLATIGGTDDVASAAENAFITANLLSAQPELPGYWLGGLQPSLSPEPGGGWEWVTAEAWSYTNWASGEPNNENNNEDRLEIFGAAAVAGQWNDVYGGSTHLRGYIVEYSIPEPVTLGLLLLGGLAMLIRRRTSL